MKVIVVGGGASGLVSAIMAARGGACVTVLERNSSCGKKILVTGNGRCNYYNSDQDLSHYHSSNSELISGFINDKNCQMVLDFFDSLGVVPKIRNGYYYPFTNQAVSVLNSILNELDNLSVNVVCDVFVKEIVNEKNGFTIKTNGENYVCDRVIVAGGTYAYYKNMEINSYDMLEKLGHTIVRPLPALVQLKIDSSITKKWAGVRVDACLKLYEDGNYVKKEIGELMLTSYGISGICAMQLSGRIARGIDSNKKEEIVINFVRDIASNSEELVNYLNNLSCKLENRTVSNILDCILNYKLGNAIIRELSIDGDMMFNQLSCEDRVRLADRIVNYKVKITGTNSFNEAQVCSGGVVLDLVNCLTMESSLIKGLYVVGELLDLDGDCGGYNLTIAWITGILAGMASSEGNY